MATKAPPAPDETVEINGHPVLDLETERPKRPVVRIHTSEHPDGEMHELIAVGELGVEEEQELRAKLRDYTRLAGAEKLKQAERQRLKTLLDELLARILLAPDEVRKQLPDRQRQRVIAHFGGALSVEDAGMAAAALDLDTLQGLLETVTTAREAAPTTGS